MASSEPNSNNGAHDTTHDKEVENALEMNTLETTTGPAEGSSDTAAPSTTTASNLNMPQTSAALVAPAHESTNVTNSTTEPSLDPLSTETPVPTTSTAMASAPLTSATQEPELSRLDSAAIGPSNEAITAPTISAEAGPVCVITLLLTSGARHPYTLDEKYLTKRNVNVPGVTENGKKDPYSISVYTLKELILREWRQEWEAQPSSPSSIRLIHFGRLLDDNTPLKDCRFNHDSPNVVHMTIRPQEVVDDEEASKSKAMERDRDGGAGTAGCRCVIL